MNTYLLRILILLLIIIIFIQLYNKYYELFYSYNRPNERIINKTDYNDNINTLKNDIDTLNINITSLKSTNGMNFDKINDLKENINAITTNFKIDEIHNLFEKIQSNLSIIYRHKINNKDPNRQVVISSTV
jgi:hypothetical protein